MYIYTENARFEFEIPKWCAYIQTFTKSNKESS